MRNAFGYIPRIDLPLGVTDMTDSSTPTTDHAHELCKHPHVTGIARWQSPHCGECGEPMGDTFDAEGTVMPSVAPGTIHVPKVARCEAIVTTYGRVGYCTLMTGHDGEHYNDNAEPAGVQ